ncbi:MAG TPA: nucleotide pyrophosphatase/phosphodiesterase family protein [Nocardioidaceae bacterium]|nr:nucleotide pyrophosphatase/phosphodiesterase family protein [Nocardioidaceae bacterium]
MPVPTVSPRYEAGSLAAVLPSALAALGVPGWANALELPAATSYVVLLVDGLGWNLLTEYADRAPYLAGLASRVEPVACGVPSTTATSLTSLGTGLPPGSHGVVGFTSRIPGTRRLLDALRWSPKAVDPVQWQVHDTVYARAAKQGVTASVVGKRAFEGSGLTGAGQRGAVYLGADSAGERIAATVAAAAQPGSLTYVYDADLDATGHRHGCRSAAWRYQLGVVDGLAEQLRAALPADCALVVTADHGMVDVASERRLDLDQEPDLLRGVDLVGGEARLRHLYCESGAVEAVAARFRERLGESALVLTRQEAVELEWFGVVEPQVAPRLGDVIVASVGDLAVMSARAFPKEAALVGLHGSLSPDEMLIPVLVDR